MTGVVVDAGRLLQAVQAHGLKPGEWRLPADRRAALVSEFLAADTVAAWSSVESLMGLPFFDDDTACGLTLIASHGPDTYLAAMRGGRPQIELVLDWRGHGR